MGMFLGDRLPSATVSVGQLLGTLAVNSSTLAMAWDSG
jgi:hypothetical protein